MKTLLFALMFAIAGCSTLGDDPNGTKQVEVACTSAASSLGALTLYKEHLSESERETVNRAITVLNPVCGDRDTVPTYTTAKLSAIESAAAMLRDLVLNKEETP